jgi:hypothetical protein
MRKVAAVLAAFVLIVVVSACPADVIFVIDYTLDTNNFFNTQTRRDALQAAANRWGRILQTPLGAVGVNGTATGTDRHWRIGFSHPGTGASWQVSTALNSANDDLVNLGGGAAADQYGFGGLQANTYILYAGGRNLGGTAGIGGTGTGLNWAETFTDPNGPFHRGAFPVHPTNPVNDLPVWGGSIAFNNTINWHFDPNTAAPSGTTDFYSIAMHEVGHVLGLATSWNQFQQHIVGSTFTGTHAVSAYNTDNGGALTSLNLVGGGNQHWQDGTYDSRIFAPGSPHYAGTVGAGNLQDLLMEPTANFTGSLRRFEATNVDVGSARDIGWTVAAAIPEPSTYACLFGLLGLGGYWYSRKQKPQAPAESESVTPTVV